MRLTEIGAVRTALQSLMRGFSADWCVAGGWAIDLFLGRATRPHNDVEVAIFRQDQQALQRHLRGWTLQKVVGGRAEAWPEDEWLSLPLHEIRAFSPEASPRSVEFLLNEREAGEWVFRRDARVRLPVPRAIRRVDGAIPILCPVVVLLFKAKQPRPKDESDFEAVNKA